MKFKGKLAALLVGSALVLAACGGGDEEASTSTSNDSASTTTDTASANGEKIFNQKCSSCHGMNLEGGVGPELTTVGSKMSQEDIETLVKDGKGAMPPGLIDGEDLTAVAEWLAAKQ
ncbi:cytochrome c551 [Bacillus tuaregi]|uniref:cytochrome c551 n=1 Tax=Bacillus tuaregi TaxID=1816695 RepID=UPI0008F8CCE2|nr:cytochrome c [Bacillus tuaregi]